MPASSTILHKRNSVSGVVPSTSSLSSGEIAVNTADGKLFTKTTDNSVQTFLNSSQLPYTLDASLSSSNYQYGANNVTGLLAGVLGGVNNDVSGAGSTVVNGSDNNIDADYAFIGNGSSNTILTGGDFGAILGGQNNTLNHEESFIIGSNITSHLSGFTYVNNLSAGGKLYGDGSELTGVIAEGVVGPDSAVRSLTSNWESTYSTFESTSSSFFQTLLFDEGTKDLSISNGNIVSLSSFGTGADTSVRSLTSQWDSVYSSVSNTSASWDSVYSTVQTNSATNWNNELVATYVNNNFVPLTGGTLTGSLSVLGDITYIDTTVAVTSAMYIDTSSSETALRITQRGFGDVIRVEDSDNPDLTPFIINSDGLVGVGTSSPNEELTVIGNVSATGSYYGDGSNLTGIVAGDTEATTLVRSNSGFWQSSYTTVSSMSANWQTTFQASSAYVSSNPTGITGASALTKLLQITQAGYNSITPASDTLYIIVG